MKMQMRGTIIILYALCFLYSGIAEAQDANSYYTKGEALCKQQQFDQVIGNRQAVPDESEFIEYLRLALQENKQKYITAEQLIDSFKNQYKTTTHLQLQYYPIKNVDDLGGQFVFTRK